MKEIISGELVTIYEGRGKKDTDEGRGGTRNVGWYLTEAEAIVGVKGAGIWGQPGTVRTRDVLKRICQDGRIEYYDLYFIEIKSVDVEKAEEEARKAALAKLTDSEKKVLGL